LECFYGKEENKNYISRYYVNKTLFELHNQNKGIAKESLLLAFEVLAKEDKTDNVQINQL